MGKTSIYTLLSFMCWFFGLEWIGYVKKHGGEGRENYQDRQEENPKESCYNTLLPIINNNNNNTHLVLDRW